MRPVTLMVKISITTLKHTHCIMVTECTRLSQDIFKVFICKMLLCGELPKTRITQDASLVFF